MTSLPNCDQRSIKKWREDCEQKESTDFWAHQDGKMTQIQDWIEINIKNINIGLRFSEFSVLLCTKFIKQSEIFQHYIQFFYVQHNHFSISQNLSLLDHFTLISFILSGGFGSFINIS